MCGIVGYIQVNRVTTSVDEQYRYALAELLFMDSLRGLDSTGIACIPKDRSNKPFVVKRAVPGYMFIDLPEYRRVTQAQANPGIYIGHNRAATRGEVSDQNAHPFVADHITLVHNGSINNMHALDSGTVSTVDSCHIAHAISRHGPEVVLSKLDGAAILVWHNARENSMNIARTKDREIRWIFDEHGTCWFASERGMLWTALRRNNINVKSEFLTLPEFHHYKWVLGEGDETPGKLIKNKFDPFVPKWEQERLAWENKRAEENKMGKGCSVLPFPQKQISSSHGTAHTSGQCAIQTTDDKEPLRRHEYHSKRKINSIDKKLACYGLAVGDEIEVTRTIWMPNPENAALGDMVANWKYQNVPVKVVLPDVPVSLWQRQASGRYRVNVYNLIQELVPKAGRHTPTLYAKPKPYQMRDLVQGPRGKLITKDEFEILTEKGCNWCHQSVEVIDHDKTEWIGDHALCQMCSVNVNHPNMMI